MSSPFHRVARVCTDRGEVAESSLHPIERGQLRHFRDAGRRRQWMLGRHLAKQLILDAAELHPFARRPRARDILIVSRSTGGLGRRPRVRVFDTWQRWSLSIAHSEQTVAAALHSDPQVSVGIDVTTIRPVGAGFRDLWLTPAERSWVMQDDAATRTCLLWAIKEAVYKALNRGESFDPLGIEVHPLPNGGWTCCHGSRAFLNASEIRVEQERSEICVIVRAEASHL